MEMFVWWEAPISTRVEWRCALTTSGGQCVMTAGTMLMQPWSASSWDMQSLKVSADIVLCEPDNINLPKVTRFYKSVPFTLYQPFPCTILFLTLLSLTLYHTGTHACTILFLTLLFLTLYHTGTHARTILFLTLLSLTLYHTGTHARTILFLTLLSLTLYHTGTHFQGLLFQPPLLQLLNTHLKHFQR